MQLPKIAMQWVTTEKDNILSYLLLLKPPTTSKGQCKIKSQLLLVNFYFVLPPFQFYRDLFTWYFLHIYRFKTQILVLNF